MNSIVVLDGSRIVTVFYFKPSLDFSKNPSPPFTDLLLKEQNDRIAFTLKDILCILPLFYWPHYICRTKGSTLAVWRILLEEFVFLELLIALSLSEGIVALSVPTEGQSCGVLQFVPLWEPPKFYALSYMSFSFSECTRLLLWVLPSYHHKYLDAT